MSARRRAAAAVVMGVVMFVGVPTRAGGVASALPVTRTSPAGTTAAFFDGEAGSFYPGDATFTSVTFAGLRGPNSPMFTVSNSTLSYSIWFAPPNGSPLTPGTYDDAQRLDFRAAGHPGLELFGEGSGCNSVAGRFIVDDATYDAMGNPLTFSVRFEHHCDGVEPALFGALSYNSTAAYRTRSLSAASLSFTPTNPSQMLSIVNNGPSTLHPGAVSFSGPIAPSLSIGSNSCGGELASGASCTVVVDYDGSRTGDGVLSFSDELAPLGPPGEPAAAGTGRDISISAVGAQHVSVDSRVLDFGKQRVGTFGAPQLVTISNFGTYAVGVSHVIFAGQHSVDYFGATDCVNRGRTRVLQPGGSCHAVVFFSPLRTGSRPAQLIVIDTAGPGPTIVSLRGSGTEGYIIAGAHGEVGVFGDAVFHGDATRIHLAAPMISLATTPNGAGYWLLARDGGIFGYGNAHFYGSTGAMKLNKPIVAMSASHDGKGYRLVASDGGIFGYGDAHFYGSTGSMHLNKPIVGMAATGDDRGYWLVGSDGGIFGFGDAHYYGSAASAHLTSPVIQIVPTPTGHGYWILTADGHLYAYGDAHSYGSATGQRTIGLAPTPDGRGYWEATRDARIYNFGDAASYGDLRNLGVDDVIGIAATAPPLPPELLPFSISSLRRNPSGLDPIPGGGARPDAPRAFSARTSR